MLKEKDIPSQIKEFNTNRVPHFLQMKYKAMYEDKYRFFRATTHLFYQDIPGSSFLREAPNVWICGDLHLENYGSYKGDNRVAYFNVNDFDESVLGSCLFDVVRMLCSIYIASGNLEITAKDAENLCVLFVETYFDKLKEGYIRVLEKETTQGVMKDFLEEVANRKRIDFLNKRTVKKQGERKLIIDDKHASLMPEDEKKSIINSFKDWSRQAGKSDFYTIKDIAYRVAGTSSLGLRRYVLLVEGKGSPDQNYLLELKETRPSCVMKYNKVTQPKWENEASRIVEVQRRILPDPPALLNSVFIDKVHFVLKELQPTADRIDYTMFKGNIKKLEEVLGYMACVYAWGNLRSSGRQRSAIADELISFATKANGVKNELLKYAREYSKMTHTYHEAFCEAYTKGYFNK